MKQINSLPKYAESSIFDLDHTICKVNTSFKFGCFLILNRFLPPHTLFLMMFWYFRHKIGLMSVSVLHMKACRFLFCGKSLTDLQILVTRFLDTYLTTMLNEPVVGEFKQAKDLGHYTVLLSSSPDFIVSEIAKRMRFHAWAGTEYTLCKNQEITGIGLLMEGEQKAAYVLNLMDHLKIAKNRVTAYSDSHLDIPLLETAGNPIVVNPDRKLRKISISRGWRILNHVKYTALD